MKKLILIMILLIIVAIYDNLTENVYKVFAIVVSLFICLYLGYTVTKTIRNE